MSQDLKVGQIIEEDGEQRVVTKVETNDFGQRVVVTKPASEDEE